MYHIIYNEIKNSFSTTEGEFKAQYNNHKIIKFIHILY